MSISGFGPEWKMEQEWLDHILTGKDGPVDISWAAFHASRRGTA